VLSVLDDRPVCTFAALCSFIKQYLNASNADEVEHLKSELESVKAENAALQKELAELKVCSHPLPASCPCSARLFRLLVRR